MPNDAPNPAALPAPAAVRALVARAALGLAPRPADARVGPLDLHPHQRHAAARLRYALRHYGVALLADDVGLGKTAVALALLRDTPNATVVAPAALRPHWTAALHAAGLTRRILTTESLGRDPPPAPDDPPLRLLIVDEAHHFRNPRTHRWRRLATLATDACLLLLSATPVHNRPDDLAALFALTLGARAHALDAATLARLVVRRSAADVQRPREARARTDPPPPDRPTVAPTVWLDLDDAPDLLDALNTLPPAIALADGTPAPDLDRYTLVRLWASSEAALRAGLRRRLARALTVGDALDTGRSPTRADLHALTRGIAADPTTLQLSLLAPPAGNERQPPPAADARRQLDAYAAGLRRALAALHATSGDTRRADYLRAIRGAHPGARVVAFSHSADTVRALYRTLAPNGRVAMLTAAGGRIASGPLPRADVLARFAPLGQARPRPPAIERIDLLLTTDALSEGLDLRDASVVVHLDWPWTPARLAQRTGRAVRPGAPAPVVHVYAFRPPPAAARDLRLIAHAHAKRLAAAQTVGSTPLEHALTPPDHGSVPERRRASATDELARDRQLERWSEPPLDSCLTLGAPRRTRVAAVRCGTPGVLAVLALPTCLGALPVPTLVAAVGTRAPTSAPAVVRRALAQLARAETTVDPPAGHVRAARRQLARWARRRVARTALAMAPSVVRTSSPARPDARAALLARAARALHAAAPAERATLAAAAATLHAALARPIAAEREAVIRDADPLASTDGAWLSAAARVVGTNAPHAAPAHARAVLRALVLLVE